MPVYALDRDNGGGSWPGARHVDHVFAVEPLYYERTACRTRLRKAKAFINEITYRVWRKWGVE